MNDPADMFFGLLFLVFVITLVVTVFDSAFYAPLSAEEAANYCHTHGYDNYADYSRQMFSSHALGVKCSYAQKQIIVATNVTSMLVSAK